MCVRKRNSDAKRHTEREGLCEREREGGGGWWVKCRAIKCSAVNMQGLLANKDTRL